MNVTNSINVVKHYKPFSKNNNKINRSKNLQNNLFKKINFSI